MGVAFFNVLEIPCFVLKEQEACVAWHWWGGYAAALLESLPGHQGNLGSVTREGERSVCPLGTMRCRFVLSLGQGRGLDPSGGITHNTVG